MAKKVSDKTFRLEVELGNDAMRTRADVAKLLLGLSRTVNGAKCDDDDGTLRDENGNLVGRWWFE